MRKGGRAGKYGDTESIQRRAVLPCSVLILRTPYFSRPAVRRRLAPFCAVRSAARARADAPSQPANQSASLGLPQGLAAGPKAWTSPEGISSSLQVMLLLAVVSLAPAALLMTTCYVRIVVVLSLLRQALGIAESAADASHHDAGVVSDAVADVARLETGVRRGGGSVYAAPDRREAGMERRRGAGAALYDACRSNGRRTPKTCGCL